MHDNNIYITRGSSLLELHCIYSLTFCAIPSVKWHQMQIGHCLNEGWFEKAEESNLIFDVLSNYK